MSSYCVVSITADTWPRTGQNVWAGISYRECSQPPKVEGIDTAFCSTSSTRFVLMKRHKTNFCKELPLTRAALQKTKK